MFCSKNFRERLQPPFNVFNPALPSPMAFCREVDDEAREGKLARFEHEHPTWLNLTPFAGRSVFLEIIWKGVLKLKRYSAPHDANAVHGVNERF